MLPEIPCPWEDHEHDGWDRSSNACRVKRVHEGYAFRCFKCTGNDGNARYGVYHLTLEHIKNLDPVLERFGEVKVEIPIGKGKVYYLNISQMEQCLLKFFSEKTLLDDNSDIKILGLKAPTGSGKTEFAIEFTLRITDENGFGKVLQMTVTTKELRGEFARRSMANGLKTLEWLAQNNGYDDNYKELPQAERKIDRAEGIVCTQAEKCQTLSSKGVNANISVCSKCPDKPDCDEDGYRGQHKLLKEYQAVVIALPQLFTDFQLRGFHDSMELALDENAGSGVAKLKDTESQQNQLAHYVSVIDEADPITLFKEHSITCGQLRVWARDWHDHPLGGFANDLVIILEHFEEGDILTELRAVIEKYKPQEELIIDAIRKVRFKGNLVKSDYYINNELVSAFEFHWINNDVYMKFKIAVDDVAADLLEMEGVPHLQLPDNLLFEVGKFVFEHRLEWAIENGFYLTDTPQQRNEIPTVYYKGDDAFTRLEKAVTIYKNSDNAPILWNKNEGFKFYLPPELNPSVRVLILMSATLELWQLRRAFHDYKVGFMNVPEMEWLEGCETFQLESAFLPRASLLVMDSDGNYVTLSSSGKFYLKWICSLMEIESDKRFCIITTKAVKQIIGPALEKYQNFVSILNYGGLAGLDEVSKKCDVFILLGNNHPLPAIVKRNSKIYFGYDKETLRFDESDRDEKGNYHDERVNKVYQHLKKSEMIQAFGRGRLNRVKGQISIILSAEYLPGISERAQHFQRVHLDYCETIDQLRKGIKSTQEYKATYEDVNRQIVAALEQEMTVDQVVEHFDVSKSRVLSLSKMAVRPTVKNKVIDLLQSNPTKVWTLKEIDNYVKLSRVTIMKQLKKLIKLRKVNKISRGKYQWIG